MGALVHEFLGRKKIDGDVGLELECEARVPRIPFAEVVGWQMKREGSLRGHAVEYVTNGAIKLNDCPAYLARLAETINHPHIDVVRDSPRTSFHVHLNCHGLTPIQMWTVANAYWLFENLLMEYCGPERVGNLFCLRLKDASGVLNTVYQDLAAKLPLTTLHKDRIRYGGLNLKALPQFGTIELRGMRGITNYDDMNRWSTALIHFRDNVIKNYENPEDFMDKFYSSNLIRFMETVFSHDFLYNHLIPLFKDRNEIIEEQAGLLAEFAYFHDWKQYEKRINEELKRKSDPRFIVEDDFDDVPLHRMQARGAAGQRIRPLHDIVFNGNNAPNNVQEVALPEPQPWPIEINNMAQEVAAEPAHPGNHVMNDGMRIGNHIWDAVNNRWIRRER